MMEAEKMIEKYKVVPVIKLEQADDAVPLAEALMEGGLPLAEITFRTDAAQEAIRRIKRDVPQVMAGAGTLTNLEQAKRAQDAGADFFVMPGFHRGIVEFALEQHIPVYPGICTPTELMMVMEYRLTVAKFFPAEAYGGIRTLKALGGPFPGIRFMPTGGIHAGNIMEYLACPNVIACGGSWMADGKLIKEKNFAGITEKVIQVRKLISGEG